MSRVTQAIRRFLALSPVERWLLVQAMATFPLVTLSLTTIGLRRCYRALERLVPEAGGGVLTGISACRMRTGWLVRAASTHGPEPGTGRFSPFGGGRGVFEIRGADTP